VAKKKETTGAAFDLILASQMNDPVFKKAYRKQLRLHKSEQQLLAALDAARERQNMTKSELARRTGTKLSAVSRLFRASGPANPRLETLLELFEALDLRVNVEIGLKDRGDQKSFAVSTHL
jgi:DNA-binding phage protein